MKQMILLLLFFQIAHAGIAQQTLTLDAIRDSLLMNHPVLKTTEAAVRGAEARAQGAYSWMAPEIGAGLFQAPYNVSRWKGTPAMPGMGMFMVSAEQMFPNRKAQDAEHEYLKSLAGVEAERRSGLLNELMSQVRIAYYNLIVIAKKDTLISQNKNLVDFMIQSAEIRYKNNLGNINSYYKLKAALAKLNTAERVLNAEAEQQRAVINTLMQNDKNGVFRIDTTFTWYPLEKLFQVEDAFNNNSEYRVMEKTLASNRLAQLSEEAALKPQFGLRFEHMVGFGHQPQMFSLMGMVKLPMAKWSARANRARIEGLIYEREGLQAQQRAFINQKLSKSRTLLAEWKGLRAELEMYESEIIPALTKNLQTLQISYEQNNAEIFELFDAWQSLLDARIEYLDILQRGMGIQGELMREFEVQ